ncbi:AraC family transcriptional regulator [Chitinophaga sp. CC14]|uniref:helix-turn-helix domain-containing protein n=1 Tax=Chitinophaga sp. CC14 TaxID=3029199 RepID=UPI003B7640D5
MPVTIPFEIRISKKACACWSAALPPKLECIRIPAAATFYHQYKGSTQFIAQGLFPQSSMAWVTHYLARKPVHFNLKASKEGFILYCILDGLLEYSFGSQHASGQAGHFNLVSCQAFEQQVVLREKCKIFYLFIPPGLLEKFQVTFPIVKKLLDNLGLGGAGQLLEYQTKDTGQMLSVIEPALGMDYSGADANLKIVGFIEKLIITALDLLSVSKIEIKHPIYISNEELIALRLVRSALLSRTELTRPPALEQLSRLANMSEKRLEDCFKSYFQMTMFDFFQAARMEAIYRAICRGERTLSQICWEFNYQDYSSFSAAVKKKLGRNPRQILRTELLAGGS